MPRQCPGLRGQTRARRGADDGRLPPRARLGLFELTWNVLCPGCGGVLESGATLKTINREEYTCAALRTPATKPTLDEMVEVTFTVSPSVRRDRRSRSAYVARRRSSSARSSGIPASICPTMRSSPAYFEEVTLELARIAARRKGQHVAAGAEAFLIVFDPVVHMAQFIEVKGEPTRERQTITAILTRELAPAERMTIRPGPLRIYFENRANVRTLPSVWVSGDALHGLLGKRRPFLTAKRLLTNQTFRDLYRADTLDVDQRLKITSLTFLFTDLKGSTELYDRVGDLVAYDLVKAHFLALHKIVAARAGPWSRRSATR